MTSVVIIGGGPGGYEAALVASQLGGEVTLIERDGLGGAAVLGGGRSGAPVSHPGAPPAAAVRAVLMRAHARAPPRSPRSRERGWETP